MKNKPNIVIHTGPIKTASTTLQKCLFSRHSGLNYYGIDYSNGHPSFLDDNVRIVFDSIADRKGHSYNERKCLETAKNIKLSASKTNLISDEVLGSAWRRPTRTIAQRLKTVFPDAKIIYVVRNPINALGSLYLHLHDGLDARAINLSSFDDFVIDVALKDNEKYSDYFSPAYHYVDIFGKENVLFLLFESLKKNLPEFCDLISEFCEIDKTETNSLLDGAHENRASPGRALFFERLKTRFPRALRMRSILPDNIRSSGRKFLLSGVPAKSPKLSSKVHLTANAHFAPQCLRFQREFGLDLMGHGYPCDKSK